MTTVTIDRALLEQAKNLLSRFMPDNFRDQNCQIEMLTRMDAALAAQPSGAEKCGHCGRRVIDPPWPIAPAAQPSGPAWHDAPNAPGIWICDEGDICYEWTAHNIEILGQFDPGAGYRWFGPIPEETK